MIAFLSGKIAALTSDAVILEVNGIGFEVLMPASALTALRPGEQLALYTYLAHREDAMLLYGFRDQQEKALFMNLISVSGIGPKTALTILSVLALEEFYQAILNEDIKLLTTVPGIGQKTAQRLILELQTKIKKEVAETPLVPSGRRTGTRAGADAVAALVTLGYQPGPAGQAVQEVESKQPQIELQDLIKEALKLLASERK
ncbi:MAG: Holliday junction branch migration protein RuvA [Firmicutes bacterium]|nr:Holliday junction branch migration protein RuvA [Bacillota bacterium]